MANKVKSYMEKGDKLCRSRIIPMSCELIEEVKNIYKMCHPIVYASGNLPLIHAIPLGLEDMVWGFIQCAKQTNTNLDNGKRGEVHKFLWLSNAKRDTAFDVAIACNHFGMAKLLFQNASMECLILERNSEGYLPVSLLFDSQHDEFILSTLEATKREVDPQPSILIPIDHQQEESKLYMDCKMDPNSYPKSQTNVARKSLGELDHGKLELTPNKNTILHLVSELGDIEYVKEILEKHPSLIYNRNSKGETAAYVAAMEGYVDILEVMFNCLKMKNDDFELLVTRSTDKHTALHIAIQHHHVGVVFWLMKNTPQLANHINNFEESPLYLAAEREYDAILKLLLGTCNEKAFHGPNGKTALHAAVISVSQDKMITDSIKHLLSSKPDLLQVQDKCGWTPFRYALHHNNSLATSALLNAERAIGYQIMTEDGIDTYAIHIAASKGYCQTMRELMYKCPGCTEITDSKGRNILHVAIENKKVEVIKLIFQHDLIAARLVNERDSNGNTPLHLLMASDLEMTNILTDSRFDINVVNNERLTPLDMASSDEKRMALLKGVARDRGGHHKRRSLYSTITRMAPSIKRTSEEPFRIVENILLVVTLIATATFAAAFTVPGGFHNEGSKQGTPILLRKPAFVAFVITNTIAFSCSTSVIFGHMVLVFYRALYDHAGKKTQDKIDQRIAVMYFLTGLAMFSMAIAFVTGLYVVLTPFLGLAIFSCAISLFIIGFTSLFPSKMWNLFEMFRDLV